MRANTFHCFTLHRLDTFCWFGVGCVVWGGCLVCLVCFLFFFCAKSVRPRYQSMTSIAYLHDCHCCHNERSIVQKKKAEVDRPWSPVLSYDNLDPKYKLPPSVTSRVVDADCRALCPEPSSQEDRTSAARSKKKNLALSGM